MSTKTSLPSKTATPAATSGAPQKGPASRKPAAETQQAAKGKAPAKSTPAGNVTVKVTGAGPSPSGAKNVPKNAPKGGQKTASKEAVVKPEAKAVTPKAPKVVTPKAPKPAGHFEQHPKKKVSRKYGAAGISLGTYIKKVLKRESREGEKGEKGDSEKKTVNISNAAVAGIDQIVKSIARTVASHARDNCCEAKHSIVSVNDVMFGASITFPVKLHSVIFQNASRIEEVTDRLRKEAEEKEKAKESAKAEGQSSGTSAQTSAHPVPADAADKKPSRREAQYNLVFSVSGAEKFLRDFQTTKLSVSNEAPVYLALFMENFAALLIRESVAEVRQYKKVNMKPVHIFRAIEGNEILAPFFKRLNIKLHGVGVVPHIFEELVPTKEEKNARYKKRAHAKAAAEGQQAEGATPAQGAPAKKPKRHLPGTKALRYIKDSQGKTGLLMQKAPFDRVVREHIIPEVCKEIGVEYTDRSKYHFRDSMVEVIQQFVEDSAIELLKDSQSIAIHCTRHGLNGSDVELAWKLAYKNVPFLQVEASASAEGEQGSSSSPSSSTSPATSETAETPADAVINMHHIGNCSIEHLATRGGVVRKGSSIHDVIRAFIKSILFEVLKYAITRVHYRRAVTINDSDIRFALSQVGVNYIFHREKSSK